MNFISIFFILMSVIVIAYLLNIFKSRKRMPILLEIFFLAVYGFIILIFLFPQTLRIIEEILGIQSAINFFLYLSIFVAYFLLFLLYQKTETQRQETTTLTREIAYINQKLSKNKEKNKE